MLFAMLNVVNRSVGVKFSGLVSVGEVRDGVTFPGTSVFVAGGTLKERALQHSFQCWLLRFVVSRLISYILLKTRKC